MEERSIYISSIDREKIGRSKTHDFKLDRNMKHEIALDSLMMTYSWHNVNENYKNNKIKYSHDGGNTWETINIVDGMYSYKDLNLYINQYMVKEGHADDEKSIQSTYYSYYLNTE